MYKRQVVVGVEANPASDLLVLDSGALVPLTFVTTVEANVRIEVDVPEGLFEDVYKRQHHDPATNAVGVVDLGVVELVDPDDALVIQARCRKHDAAPVLGLLARVHSLEGDDEALLVRDRRHHAQRSALGDEFAPGRESFPPVAPEIDEDLALEALGFDDPPDFERGALFGAHD